MEDDVFINEIKISFNEDQDKVIFSTNIGVSFADEYYILSMLTLEEFEKVLLRKGKQLFNYYREKILDEKD